MAAVAAKLILVLVILQTVAALVLIITGILDRVEAKDRPQYISSPLSFLVMPVWTGSLIFITAGLGFIVVVKWNRSLRSASRSSSVLPITVLVFKSLNITCAFLCGLIVFWYGTTGVAFYAEYEAVKENSWVDDDTDSSDDQNVAVMTIIFVMAIIEFFLCVLGTMASRNSPSPYTQLLDFPVDAYNPQAEPYLPPGHVTRQEAIEAGFQSQATANQPATHATSQANSPVLFVPAYPNQMGITEGPVMLLPTQNMQQQ